MPGSCPNLAIMAKPRHVLAVRVGRPRVFQIPGFGAGRLFIVSTLYKRGDIYWAQIYRNGRRKRMSLRTRNHGLARSKVTRLEHQLETEGFAGPTATTVGEIVAKFAEHLHAQNTAKSVQVDLYRVAEFFGPVCDALVTNSRARRGRSASNRRSARRKRAKVYDCKVDVGCLEDVTTAMVSDFLVDLEKKRNLSPKTLNGYREILQRLFNWAIRVQGIRMPDESRRNPVTDVPRFKTYDKSIRFLSIDEIHVQLEALTEQPQLLAMVATYIYAGLRREEALWLTGEDVDLEQRRIHVRAKTVDDRFWKPKTGRNRVVPISAALAGYLKKYTPAQASAWYFPSPKGCWCDPDNFSRALRKANHRAGLVWTCLDYRHTFGSQLAQRGESLYKISKILGNSPEICRRHYAALTAECLQACVDFDGTTVGSPTPHDPPKLKLVRPKSDTHRRWNGTDGGARRS